MSVIYQKQKKKKKKYPRNRVSRKVIHKQKLKKKILKTRGWKLKFPNMFEYIDEYPYIVKKDN
ncbi:MAG: hypothetical protein ACFFCE_15300 [Promethearchaeota archaeon]